MAEHERIRAASAAQRQRALRMREVAIEARAQCRQMHTTWSDPPA
jgi:hypothetical protein